jgi:hypothetical protein
MPYPLGYHTISCSKLILTLQVGYMMPLFTNLCVLSIHSFLQYLYEIPLTFPATNMACPPPSRPVSPTPT